MGSIRLDAVTEYVLEPIRRCCQDGDPYVRKTAVLSIAKLYDLEPDMVEDQGLIEVLQDLVTDSNPAVVANCVVALYDISKTAARNAAKEAAGMQGAGEQRPGGSGRGVPAAPNYLQLNETSIANLFAALNECSEWGQIFVLDAISTYNAPTARSAEMILDRVVARLSHVNEAVVLSAVKVVLKNMDKLTNADTLRVLTKKLSPPLITLLNSEPEIQ